MITVTIFEAKTNLSELLKKAQAGEIVIIIPAGIKRRSLSWKQSIPLRSNVSAAWKIRTLF
jgi:antitoxin (DNA-binding transcriptional repressor) of toxin-antitoxin stability system